MKVGDLMRPSPGLRVEKERGNVGQEKFHAAPYVPVEIRLEGYWQE